jgi:hypothetical protein
MLKYNLVVTGDKNSIDIIEQRLNTHGVTVRQANLDFIHHICPQDITFITVTPEYRIRTLGELAKRFGDRLTLKFGPLGEMDIGIHEYQCALQDLGKSFAGELADVKYRNVSLSWREIFLKEEE